MAAFVATLPMPQPDYKIYRMLPNGTSVWMENANNLQATIGGTTPWP